MVGIIFKILDYSYFWVVMEIQISFSVSTDTLATAGQGQEFRLSTRPLLVTLWLGGAGAPCQFLFVASNDAM